MKEVRVNSHAHTMMAVVLSAGALLGCKDNDEAKWLGKLNEANDKIVVCRNEVNELKSQVADLKQKLAIAATAPQRLQLTDPDILNLIADLKSKRPMDGEDGEVVIGKGDLNPKEASRVVRQGAQGLQSCYERALKKNSALQMQTGLNVLLEITVKPSGKVGAASLAPQVDADMSECVRTLALRWKFPPFGGEPVVVTQRLTLTPKT